MRTFISGRDPYTPDYIHMHNLVHSQLIIVYFQYIASGFLPFSARGRRFETYIAYHLFYNHRGRPEMSGHRLPFFYNFKILGPFFYSKLQQNCLHLKEYFGKIDKIM